jgi:hypothetical protein
MTVIKFPGHSSKSGIATEHDDEEAPAKVEWRSREHVQQDIDRHIAARAAYAQAAAWAATAESANLPAAQIEDARSKVAAAFEETTWRGRSLCIYMPTDLRALVDLLMYLEKNFTILPQEMIGRSLAFDLLRTMRLSLRRIEKYGKYR